MIPKEIVTPTELMVYLATANLLIVLIVYFIDRFRPEPLLQLTKALFIGVTAGALLPIIYHIDAYDIIIGGWIKNETLDTFWCAFVEETVKLFALLVVVKTFKELDEPIDAIVYSALVASGFALLEDLMYGLCMLKEGYSAIAAAAVRSVPGHVLFTTITGFFVGEAFFNRKSKWTILLGLLIASIVHTLFNLSKGLVWRLIVVLTIALDTYLVRLSVLRTREYEKEIGLEERSAQKPTLWQLILHFTASIGYTFILFTILTLVGIVDRWR